MDQTHDDPETTARSFLAALEARDLPAATALLAPGAVMTFPGGAVFTDLSQLIGWARPRYARVAKTIAHTDIAGGVVHLHGTLHGTWPDGTPFDGIRFIDRFEVANGRIVRQDVWNDLAEARART